MFQTQYYNQKLSKSQMDQIVNNFNIKYTTFETQVELKIKEMIRCFLKDISHFLEHSQKALIEEKDRAKEIKNAKKEIKLLREKLSQKDKNEVKLKIEIDSLNKELTAYKEKEMRDSLTTAGTKRLGGSVERKSVIGEESGCSSPGRPQFLRNSPKKRASKGPKSAEKNDFSSIARHSVEKIGTNLTAGEFSLSLMDSNNNSVNNSLNSSACLRNTITHDSKRRIREVSKFLNSSTSSRVPNKKLRSSKVVPIVAKEPFPSKDIEAYLFQYDQIIQEEITNLENEEKLLISLIEKK